MWRLILGAVCLGVVNWVRGSGRLVVRLGRCWRSVGLLLMLTGCSLMLGVL